MPPFSIDLTVIYDVSMIGAVVCSLAGTIFYTRFRSEKAEEVAKQAKAEVVELGVELTTFRIHAAQNYVTSETLGRIEGRLGEMGQEMRADIKDIKDTIISALASLAIGKKD